MRKIKEIKQRLLASRFFKDSFWAVFGSGLGYGFMLLAGIVIARLLGKDLYGQYGFVKTTMFQFASFATLGLGYTSTKFVAEHKQKNDSKVKPIINASLSITLTISCVVAIGILIFANPLAVFLKEPTMALALRALAAIVILRAVATTQFGILAGLGEFRKIAYNNTISGGSLLVACVPLTYFFSLDGSLASLALSQLICVLLNHLAIHGKVGQVKLFKEQGKQVLGIIKFSVPVALQELTYALSRWLGLLIISRLGSFGEVGLYTASDLWNSVILIIPSLLSNVVLSHLSSNADNIEKQKKNVNMMLLVNFICTIVPFLAVVFASPLITKIYGPSFNGMLPVLRIITCCSIFTCCSNVLSAEILAQGATWTLFTIRGLRDFLMVAIGYTLISINHGGNAALNYSIGTLACTAIFFCMLFSYYKIILKKQSSRNAAN